MRELFGMFLLLLWNLERYSPLVQGIKVSKFGVEKKIGSVFVLSNFLNLLLRVRFYMNWLERRWPILLLDWKLVGYVFLNVRKAVNTSEL